MNQLVNQELYMAQKSHDDATGPHHDSHSMLDIVPPAFTPNTNILLVPQHVYYDCRLSLL